MSQRLTLLMAAFFLLIAFVEAADIDEKSASSSPAAMIAIPEPWTINVSLQSAIYLPTPRPVQDVFVILNETTPDLVYRIERDQAENPENLAKIVYAASDSIPHDTYKLQPDALGPFPKSETLGFTLNEWLEAEGSGTYVEENNNATLNLTFHNLVPNGTYSLWCHRVTMPPNYTYEFSPIGSSDGSQNVFIANSVGNSTFYLEFVALPTSTNITFQDYAAMYVTNSVPVTGNVTWTLIAASYHSDGQSHGATPGELGKTTHVQLVHLMYPKPARSFSEWRVATAATVEPAENTPATEEKNLPGFEGILAAAGLLASVCIFEWNRAKNV